MEHKGTPRGTCVCGVDHTLPPYPLCLVPMVHTRSYPTPLSPMPSPYGTYSIIPYPPLPSPLSPTPVPYGTYSLGQLRSRCLHYIRTYLHMNLHYNLYMNLHYNLYMNLHFNLHMNLHFNLHMNLHFNLYMDQYTNLYMDV